jgi:hypothetical protein
MVVTPRAAASPPAYQQCRSLQGLQELEAREIHDVQAAQTWRHTKALNPVMALPTISVFISLVPS